MSTVVVLGCADQALSYELRSQLGEIGDVDVAYVADSTQELTSAVLRYAPDVVFLHEEIGPQPYLDVMRDLALRRPGTATVLITNDAESATFVAAMEAGARGVIPYPFTFSEVQQRLQTAAEWARSMQRLVAGDGGADGGGVGARVAVIAGAKGGVGATTIAVHFGLDIIHEVPGYRVVLVDLDLEKGDVSSLLDVRYRTSLADLAKVADDLSARTVIDAVVPHESGLHILPAPMDVRDVEFVSPTAVRRIIALLRQHYDLVLIDAGSHVTPVQAAAVELADEVLSVTTADVLSLRAFRRQVRSWEQVGVRKADGVRLLVNKASRDDEVQPDTVRRLAQAPVVSAALPAMFRRLEAAVNSRDASVVREQAWFDALRAIGQEVGLVRPGEQRPNAAELLTEAPSPSRVERGRRRRRTEAHESGQVTLEFVTLLPFILLFMLLCWQVGLTAASTVWANSAANAASHAVSVGEPANHAALNEVPGPLQSRIQVSQPSPGEVRVNLTVPLISPSLGSPWHITITRHVVVEP
jgi:pilus assembly protein CpaE